MSLATRLLPLCSIGLGLGLGLAWFGTRSTPAPGSAPTTPAAATAPAPVSAAFVQSTAPSVSVDTLRSSPADEPMNPPSAQPAESEPASALSDDARSALVAEMEAAYTTYDPASLPKLAPKLRHADPEIRAFAREAIVQLGHADGVPLLRKASREARDPREAAALLEAAEFLELPPAPPAPAAPPRASAPVARQTVRTTPAASF